jgi:hypothetical protein
MNANRGKLLIVAILGLGLAGALAAVGYNFFVGRRALEYWGPEAARLIGSAEAAELVNLKLGSVRRKTAQGAKGFLNLRRTLLLDAAFDWSSLGGGPRGASRDWRWGVDFRGAAPEEHVLVVFSSDGWVASDGDPDRAVKLDEAAARPWLEFFAEQFPPRDPSPAPGPDNPPRRG